MFKPTPDQIRETLTKLAGERVYVQGPGNQQVRISVSGELKYAGNGIWSVDNRLVFPESLVYQVPKESDLVKNISIYLHEAMRTS